MSEATLPDAPAHTPRSWPIRLTHLLFAAALWFVATFAFFGELGQWRDDPAYCFRDHATGENKLTFGKPTVNYFFRPLYYMTQPWQQSELGGSPLNHFISALVQALIAALAYRLLRRLGVWRAAACAAAVALYVMPQTWEISYYLAAMPTGLSCGTFLLLALVSLRWFRARPGGWMAWAMPPVVFILALSIPCWNEQIGAAAPAVLLLCLGERRPDGKPPLLRGLAAGSLAGAAQALYVALYWATRPGEGRGSAGSLARPHELADRLFQTFDGFEVVAFMKHRFGSETLREGWRAIAEHPAPAVIMAVVVALVSAGWLVRVTRTSHADSPNASPRRAIAAIAFGIATFALAWLPIIIVRGENVESRTLFPPMIGLVIAAAGLVQLATGAPRRAGRATRFALAAAFVAACIPSLVMLVGIQSAMHKRAELNERQGEQLRRLIPNPSPWTAFVPLEIMGPKGSKWSRFSATFTGPWEHAPASTAALRATYRRGDLAMGWRRPWIPNAPVLDVTSEGLIYDDRLTPANHQLFRSVHRAKEPPTLIPWSKLVPFVIDPEGNVVLVHLISVKRKGADDGEETVERYRVESVLRLASADPKATPRLAHVRLKPDERATLHPVVFWDRSK